jgi:hypothetical protein
MASETSGTTSALLIPKQRSTRALRIYKLLTLLEMPHRHPRNFGTRVDSEFKEECLRAARPAPMIIRLDYRNDEVGVRDQACGPLRSSSSNLVPAIDHIP